MFLIFRTRRQRRLVYCVSVSVFSQQGVFLDSTAPGRHPQVPPSPLPHSLFLPLSVNTYWIRWAAVGGWVLIDILKAGVLFRLAEE